MQKALPPATWDALSPPAGPAFPYTFFADAAQHPFRPQDTAFNLRNAWWLIDAAFLSYSPEAAIKAAWATVPGGISVRYVRGKTTECYIADGPEWIILAWRGTQVDDPMASALDWLTDARFFPTRDSHGNMVHSGFVEAVAQVWREVASHVRSLQQTRRRPFWITGHSLGAALATVASSLCGDQTDLGLTGSCTYGSPRVGDGGFGRRIKTPIVRFQNNTDLVTHVPLGLLYHHVGARAFIDAGGHLHRHLSLPDWLVPADPQALRRLVTSLKDRQSRPPVVPGFLADHAPVNYATLIWNCYDRG